MWPLLYGIMMKTVVMIPAPVPQWVVICTQYILFQTDLSQRNRIACVSVA